MFDSHFISIFHLNRLPNTTSCLLSGFFFVCSKAKVCKRGGTGWKPGLQLLCVCRAAQRQPRDIGSRGGPCLPLHPARCEQPAQDW